MSFYDITTLGTKTYGEDDTTDGIYLLNGVSYVVIGETVTKRDEC